MSEQEKTMPKISPKIIFNNMMPIDTYENPKIHCVDLTQPIASENVEHRNAHSLLVRLQKGTAILKTIWQFHKATQTYHTI